MEGVRAQAPLSASGVVHLELDLADAAAVSQALAPNITHVFYDGCSPCPEVNSAVLRNVLSAVVPSCLFLVHVCLHSRKQSIEPLTGVPAAMRPYSEDLKRLECPDLEQALLDELTASRSDGAAITWSVHSPTTIFGLYPRSSGKVVASLCVYAAICRKEGVALRWPGSRVAWEGFCDASDAEFVAEHALWAALKPNGKNNAFKVTNGVKWKQLWPALARHFQVEWSGYDGEHKRFKLVEAMAGKDIVWAQIVMETELVLTKLDDVTTWWLVDAVINADKYTMNKNKEHGFLGFQNTKTYHQSVKRLVIPNLWISVWMALIVCIYFVTKVEAHVDTCPNHKIAYYILPRNECPAVYIEGAHWLHGKKETGEWKSGSYLGDIKCAHSLDILLVLGCLSIWSSVWKLNPTKQVRFLSFQRKLVHVWIDHAIANIIYYASWAMHGHFLNLSLDHRGKHITTINSVGWLLSVVLLCLVVGKHRRSLEAGGYAFSRLLVLSGTALVYYVLWNIKTFKGSASISGFIGCIAVVVMYALKWATIVKFKWPATLLNICAIPTQLWCIDTPHIWTFYGFSYLVNLCFWVTDLAKSEYFRRKEASTEPDILPHQL